MQQTGLHRQARGVPEIQEGLQPGAMVHVGQSPPLEQHASKGGQAGWP